MNEQITNFITQNGAIILPIISLWTIIWKGLALWKSAQKKHKVFFVLILILNSLGLLEIIYIFFLSKVDYSKLENKVSGLLKKIKK